MLLWMFACDEAPQRIYSSADLARDVEAYEEWEHAPGWPDVHAGCEGSHAPFVEIWLNDVAFAAFDGATDVKSLPDAAALVLQVYSDVGETPGTLMAMRKVEGLDPDNGDWFWGAFDPEGEVLASGSPIDPVGGPSVAECVSCHQTGADFVRFPSVSAVAADATCP